LGIQRCLDDEPVTAVKPSPIYQFQKFARRRQAALAAAACFAFLLTVSAGVAAAQAIQNRSLFTAAEEARLKVLSAKERETELRRIALNSGGFTATQPTFEFLHAALVLTLLKVRGETRRLSKNKQTSQESA
jgi:hypothetical protein